MYSNYRNSICQILTWNKKGTAIPKTAAKKTTTTTIHNLKRHMVLSGSKKGSKGQKVYGCEVPLCWVSNEQKWWEYEKKKHKHKHRH